MNLNQVTLPARDLSVSIPFYQNLGLKLIIHTHENYCRFECPDGESTFSLHRVDELPNGEGAWIYFEVEDLDQYVYNLLTLGIQFDQLPLDMPWNWREARLKDPDGNQLILFYAGEDRKNPPWRLKE